MSGAKICSSSGVILILSIMVSRNGRSLYFARAWGVPARSQLDKDHVNRKQTIEKEVDLSKHAFAS